MMMGIVVQQKNALWQSSSPYTNQVSTPSVPSAYKKQTMAILCYLVQIDSHVHRPDETGLLSPRSHWVK
jgi:hypothetical protein